MADAVTLPLRPWSGDGLHPTGRTIPAAAQDMLLELWQRPGAPRPLRTRVPTPVA